MCWSRSEMHRRYEKRLAAARPASRLTGLTNYRGGNPVTWFPRLPVLISDTRPEFVP